MGNGCGGVLSRVPAQIAAEVTEIRLRTGKPLGLMASAKVLFVDENGGVSDRPALNAFLLTKADMQDSFVTLCGWAVHSHQRELCDGYLSVRGGHRAGIAATAVAEEGKVTAVRDITSINLRVAREIYGAADPLVRGCFLGQAVRRAHCRAARQRQDDAAARHGAPALLRFPRRLP